MLNLSNALEKLSGWQRAWVLCSIIWFVVVVISSFSDFPTKNEQIAAMKKFDSELFPPQTYNTNSCFDGNAGLDMANHEHAGKCLEVMRRMRDNEIYSRMERDKYASGFVDEHIFYQQTSFLGKRFMYWLLAVVGLYVAGLMVSWVIRGFKSDRR